MVRPKTLRHGARRARQTSPALAAIGCDGTRPTDRGAPFSSHPPPSKVIAHPVSYCSPRNHSGAPARRCCDRPRRRKVRLTCDGDQSPRGGRSCGPVARRRCAGAAGRRVRRRRAAAAQPKASATLRFLRACSRLPRRTPRALRRIKPIYWRLPANVDATMVRLELLGAARTASTMRSKRASHLRRRPKL